MKLCKLSDIALVTMGQSPQSEHYNSEGEGIPFLQGNRTFGRKYPTFDTYTTFVTKRANAGDVIMSVRAPVGDLNITPVDMCLGRGVCSLRMNNGNQEYLYYLMKYNVAELINKESGTVFGSVNRNDINNLQVNIHEEDEQIKIARFLSAIDEKIEQNEKINNNLEQQIQLLLSSWLNNNQAEADDVTLGDVCSKVTDGSHYSPKDDITSTIPMLSVKDMGTYDFDLGSCKHISEEDYAQMVANDCVPLVNDILVAKDGSYLKEIFICNEQRKLAILSSIAIFRPNLEKIYPEILLAFLKTPSVLREVKENYVSGSALPRIVLKDFKKLRFKLPPMAKQHELANILSSIRAQIAMNVWQIGSLTTLRDALLPRLMSGELDVSEVEI